MKSVNHKTLGAGALKSRCTRSSQIAGPGDLRATFLPFLVVVDQIRSLADPVNPILADCVTTILQFVGEEPVAEGWIVVVQVKQHIGQVRVVPIALAEGILEPLVVTLLGKAQHRRSARRGSLRRPVLGPAGTSF